MPVLCFPSAYAGIGHHFYITCNGVIHPCRPVDRVGVHARGQNDHSIGMCYEGDWMSAVVRQISARWRRRFRCCAGSSRIILKRAS